MKTATSSDPNKNNIKTAYRQSISVYDEILLGKTWWSKLYLSLFWGGVSDLEIANQLLARIPAAFSGKILDVPVGTGVFTAPHYQKLDSATIIGLDYSEDMLKKCRALMDRHAVAIKLLPGDVGALDFADATFDLIISMNGFHVFPYKDRAYENILRVLKPNGRFLGCFYIKGQLKAGDFLVKRVLAPKGWFSPPFETKDSFLNKLRDDFEVIWHTVNGAVISFEAIKK